MSCRGTNGNSATTSMAKFISGADDTLVSQVFHELRREAIVELEDNSKDKEEDSNVLNFIRKGIEKAQSDSRIRDSRRESLALRYKAAENDVVHGNGPDRATFLAWERLEGRLLNLTPSTEALTEDTTVATSPEGIQIALGDVLAVRRLANEYKMHKSAEAIKKYNELSERANRSEAAYDSSDIGYKALLNSPDSDPSSTNYPMWLARVEMAKSNRNKHNIILDAKNAASTLSIEVLRQQKASLFSRIKDLEKKNDPNNALVLSQLKKEYQRSYRNYLYGVSHNAKISHIATHKNLKSPTMWSRLLEQKSEFQRDSLWASAEMLALDLDRASYKMGLISNLELERRALVRAEARQGVLDGLGNQEVDPVNRAYADKIRFQRRLAIDKR
jgi:hypothetical protein